MARVFRPWLRTLGIVPLLTLVGLAGCGESPSTQPPAGIATSTSGTAPTDTPTSSTTPGKIVIFKVMSQFGIASMLSGSITTGPDGALWFTDGGADAIGRMTTSGVVTEWATPTRSSEPGETTLGIQTNGITAGPDGNLWFTEDHNGEGQIGRITPSGVVTEFPVAGSSPTSIAKGADGNLWFTDYGFNNAIGRITPTGVIKEFRIPTDYSGPNSIVAGSDGNLWFLEAAKIGRITTSGVITEYPIPGNTLSLADGMALGPDGNLWVTVNHPNGIARITLNGAIQVFPLPDAVSPIEVAGITAGPDGNLWFTEAKADNIGRITPTGVVQEFAVPSGTLPIGITSGPDGNIWFTETNVYPAIGRVTP